MKTRRNPVARHLRTYNRSVVQRDRKATAKRGYRKYRGRFPYEN